MARIASYVRKGAMSYLKQQYKIVTLVFIGLAALFAIMAYGFNFAKSVGTRSIPSQGGFFSGLSGYLGMKPPYASARTANAARNSLNKGLKVAFRSGAVMGLVVVGLGLFDISFLVPAVGFLYSGRCTESHHVVCHHHHDADF